MVYKKYIKRGDKIFGPYYYRSVKKGGKVITQYVKDPRDFPQKKFALNSKKNLDKSLILSIVFLALIFGLLIFNPVFIGKVILSVDELYASGDFLFGNLKLNLDSKEFIPASTNVIINSNEQESAFVLKDLINEPPKQGEFSISGTDISGFGEGYGVKEEYPEVSFTINFFKSKEKDKFDQKGLEENQTNETEIAEIPSIEITEENTELIEEVIEEPLLEIPAESPRDDTAVPSVEEQDADFPKKTPPGAEKKDENKPVEIPSEKPANKESVETLVTGNAIGSFFSAFYLAMAGKVSLDDVETIEGSVSKNKPFIYKLKEDQTVQIIESNQEISFEIIGNEAIITTNYTKNESEYLINLSELGVSAGNDLEIKLEYGGIEFYSVNKNLNLQKLNETNQTIQEINFSSDNSTIQYGAVLGEPVKWKKTIKASEQDTIVELPAQAENISIYKIETSNTILNADLNVQTIGNLILEYKSPKKNFFSNFVSFFTGRAIEITEKTEKIEVNISENGAEYEVVYKTPGPVAFEKNISYGKEVIISSEVHYENVLAYTSLPKKTNLEEIKLYNVVDGSKISVDFIAYNENNEIVESNNDLDNDVLAEIEEIVNKKDDTIENKSLIYGEESEDKIDYSVKKIRAKGGNLVSYIEWIVPSLSNQTYELILITKAQHLDSNRNFISDIYEEVKALDGNWSEQINDSEYVRVTFEKNLTNQNDITIFPRTISNGSVKIEVYEFNKTELIAEFTNITDNEYNKVYLTNLGKGNSYDNETEILTENGWKYFYELNGERVATLNQETNKLEWQLPSNKHSFDYDGEMYKIVLEDGSELLVSPQHKVYVNEKNKEATSVASKVMQILADYNNYNNNMYLNLSDSKKQKSIEGKKEKGSNRMVEPNLLIADYNDYNNNRYLNLFEFSLKKVTEVYDSINNGNEIYFLNSNNEPVKVDSISKEEYNGKIYDVDIENDIILVKRKKGSNGMAEPNRLNNFPSQDDNYKKNKDATNVASTVMQIFTDYNNYNNNNYLNLSDYRDNAEEAPVASTVMHQSNKLGLHGLPGASPGWGAPSALYDFDMDGAVWSGNSESYSQNVFDLKILGGSVEFDYIVDPIILGNANSTNTNTTYENNFTHLNISNSSIKLYMPFDENYNSTFTYDYTNNSNDGTLVGGTIINTTGCVYGNCYTFDGSNDYITVPDSANLKITNALSVSVWVKTGGTNDYSGMVDKFLVLSGYQLSFDTLGNLRFDLGKGGTYGSVATSGVNVENNNWHNVVATYNGTDGIIYIDNIQRGTGTVGGPLATTTQAVTIGTDEEGANRRMTGNLDEVMIWNTVLNSTEVADIYKNQTKRFHGTGEMNYTGVNFAGNDTINITLAGCQQNMGTSLRAKVNNGAYVNFDSSCFIKDYNATGNLNSANVTIGFVSDANRFYTPLVIGNISLDSRDVIVPNLTINFPTNNSFSSQTNLSINFTAQSQDLNTCWYSNDSYTANTTLTNCNTNITTVQWSEGQHNVTIWVNDTANSVNSSRVTFTIDTTFPVPVFANPTTNATNLSQNFIQVNVSVTEINLNTINISLFNSTQNIINSTFGTASPLYINFTGLADGTYYLNATMNDSANNINYTGTRIIGLDSVAPNLTINSPSATTYTTSTILFNATSIDLTTLVDSCWYTTNSGATNRTLSRAGTSNSYNFTQTSIADAAYTARFYCNDSANNVNNTENVAFTIDTSVPVGGGPAPAPAGGAGGAPKPSPKRVFNLNYKIYDQTISLNQVKFDMLQITNNGETADEYNIEVKIIDNIISFEEKKIKLKPGETKGAEFRISSPKEPGIYTGKIIVSNGISEREVLTAINVKTEKSLFDITLTIPESLKTLLVGENLISKIDLIQMGLKENIDITLNYLVKDFEGQTYLSESETIAVFDQKSYEKEFFTGELPPGQYILGTELIHPDGVAVASTHFVVQEKGFRFGKEEILLSSLILALIIISLVIFLSIRKYKRVGRALARSKLKK